MDLSEREELAGGLADASIVTSPAALAAFVEQKRMKIASNDYVPCYRVR